MINVSKEFKQLMNVRTDFKQNAEITFTDGTVLELTEKDFTIDNNSVTDGADSNGIPLGVAVCRSIQIEIMNDDERFSTYDFFGARIRLYLTFQLSESVERIEYGTFTVLTPETYGETVIITALDDMYKADKDYIPGIAYPATLQAILVDACNSLDIPLGTTSFANHNFIVSEAPTEITFRQLIGYVAMLAGGNARIDVTGRLRIISYDFAKLDDVFGFVYAGGQFKPWDNVDNLHGGTFNPWTAGDTASGGTYGDRDDVHILYNWSNLKVDTDDVVITGIQTEYTDDNNEDQTVIFGSEGYVLSIENPLIAGKESDAVAMIGAIMIGGRFRQFSGDLVANPTCEFMDLAMVLDRKGNSYITFITDVNFQFFGFTTLKNSAEPALRNSAKTYSEAAKTFVKARKLITEERTARELAVEQLAKDLKNSSGLFMTEEVQSDKSVIYYMHDKPTLAESMIVWKLTALAFGISTDGGKTYPYGFTVDGTTITRLLYAEGIDADYINSGAIRIADNSGEELFYADYNTKEVRINANNVFIGSQNVSEANTDLSSRISVNAENITAEVSRAKDAENDLSSRISVNAGNILLQVKKGEVSSQLSVESGAVSIKSNRFSWESTYSSLSSDGKLTASEVNLTGKITAKSGTIGGFTIGTSALYTSSASTLGGVGVHVGTDGISCKSSSRHVILNGDGSAEFYTSDGVKIYSSSTNYCYIKPNGITIRNSSYSDTEYTQTGITCGSGFSIESNSITLDATSIGAREIILRAGSALEYADFSSGTSYVYGGNTGLSLGRSNKSIGFFGSTGATKKTISNLSSTTSATASTVASKLNDLLTALRGYGLIA